MDSILTSIKKMLGIIETYTDFDPELIIFINSILSVATSLGVGPAEGFIITDKDQKWSDWFAEDNELETIKSYVYLRVRMLFDPPTNSAVTKSFEQTIKELEWRLMVATDPEIVAVVDEISDI